MELQGRNQSVVFVEIISGAVFCTEFSNSSFLKRDATIPLPFRWMLYSVVGAELFPSSSPFTDELVHLSQYSSLSMLFCWCYSSMPAHRAVFPPQASLAVRTHGAGGPLSSCMVFQVSLCSCSSDHFALDTQVIQLQASSVAQYTASVSVLVRDGQSITQCSY